VIVSALLLLLCANGAPILAERVLGERWKYPVDGGLRLADGYPLFGTAKTYRGIGAALLGCSVFAEITGLSFWMGAIFAFGAMTGDLFSSFIKRRLGITPSGQAIGLDQIPEAMLPLWLLQQPLELTGGDVLMLTAVFVVVELALSRLLYRWHIRKRPY